MPDSFGARLRLRREEQGIALGTIAEELKIKLSLLEAVERDDVSNWPSGIYRRAFIRAYAHAIGLNPDVVVREFLELYPDPEHLVASAPVSASDIETARTSSGPPTRLRNIVGSAFGSLVRLGRVPATEDSAAASWAQIIKDPVAARWAPVSAPAPAAPTEPITPSARDAVVTRAADRTPLGSAKPVASAPEDIRTAAPDTAATISQVLFTELGSTGAAHDVMAEPEPEPEAASVATPVAEAAPAADSHGAPRGPFVQVKNSESLDLDFLAVAHLCTDLGRVRNAEELQPLLQEAARIIGATGIIVWLWDPTVEELAPTLVHGYSDKVLAQLPTVRRDADNATAAAFRSARTCAINGSAHSSGALVVPLVESYGCAGVLAIELQDGREQTTFVEAAATIVAAALTQLIGRARPVEATTEAEMIDEKQVENFTRPLRVRR